MLNSHEPTDELQIEDVYLHGGSPPVPHLKASAFRNIVPSLTTVSEDDCSFSSILFWRLMALSGVPTVVVVVALGVGSGLMLKSA